jgi:hypothetical protein
MKDMTAEDWSLLNGIVKRIDGLSRDDIKASQKVTLSVGTANVYHMGAANPTVRIDIKVREEA